ncbi:MAG: restriction endonuclease [Verrucomicrobiota bacterium]
MATSPLLILGAIVGTQAFRDLIIHFLPVIVPLSLVAGATFLTIIVFDGANLSNPISSSDEIGSFSHLRHQDVDTKWSAEYIQEQLEVISSERFENFCTALLRAEGSTVEHACCSLSGQEAELVTTHSNGIEQLIHCRNHNTFNNVTEEELWEIRGCIAYMQMRQGALYTTSSWSEATQCYAEAHQIELCSGERLAERAHNAMTSASFLESITTKQLT